MPKLKFNNSAINLQKELSRTMAIKKNELYSSLWASCDELRGGMDASQYKDYVLTLLFMKYVSDKYAGDPHGMIEVPEGGSFDDLVKLKNDKEIGDKINIIIGKLAEENDLKGVIDVADFNDEDKLGKGKDMVDRLTKLVGIFQGLNFSANRVEGDDLLGDAYEYLMRHFATDSGKSKGQFYTPSEVSRILAKVVGITGTTDQAKTVYDPTCGSGSLLLKAADEAPRGLSIFGQEMDNATAALARMNMILHDNVTAKIWQDNTLASPQWKDVQGNLKTFDFAVANPPFSFKSWSSGINLTNDEFKRFEYGVPPDKNGDFAFLLHILKSLNSVGKGAVILPHGVLFRGNAEARIREKLIHQGYIKGIIGLPANLFYGTGIPACIIVLDKEQATARKGIFMLDASKGFIKDGNKNRLRSQDIHKIVDVFTRHTELKRYSRMVSFSEISDNDYNLNIPRYIDASEPEDLHDLSAHLSGGIPNADIDALNAYWQVFPTLRATLFKPAREGYSDSLIESQQVKTTILEHPEFKTFAEKALAIFKQWQQQTQLKEIAIGDKPKALIYRLSESLLNDYAEADLLSKYDIYQILMDYWEEVMQDDVYVLTQDGWLGGRSIRQIYPKKDKNGKNVWKEFHDFEFNKERFKAEIIPPKVVINIFFEDEWLELTQLQKNLDIATEELDIFIEKHNGETDLLAKAKNDKDKIVQKLVTARIKELKIFLSDEDELDALTQCLSLVKSLASCRKEHKDFKLKLDLQVFEKYSELTELELKKLIVDEKWLTLLESNFQTEIERVTQLLANRVKTLEERYAQPLPHITEEVSELSAKVDGHLQRMGLLW